MAWIACDVSLPNNPKTLDLADLMSWSPPETVGRLHMLWGWCLEFADDGNLDKFQAARIAQAMGLPPMNGDHLIRALIESGWVDETPYLRVHDWWSIIGRFLKGRYASDPERWRGIQRVYDPGPRSPETSQQLESNSAQTVDKLDDTVQNSIIHKSTEYHLQHHQTPETNKDDDGAVAGKLPETSQTDLSSLKREIIRSCGMRRISEREDERLLDLLKRHGPGVAEACQHLHSGIDNVVGYLTKILDPTDDNAEMAKRVEAILKKGGMS